MANLNISIDLTKLPGAKVMDVEGKTQTKRCVVIPIDDHVGTVCEGYLSQNPDGTQTMKSFEEVKLQVVAIEYKQKKHGISHGLKPSFSQQYQERMTEEQLYNTPWIGTVKPWSTGKTDDIGDLPEADNSKDW